MTPKKVSPDPDLIVPNDADSITFANRLVERGEAVDQSHAGALPPKVTHLIVGRTDAGHPILKRVRFSAF
jgi:hypothetical protein